MGSLGLPRVAAALPLCVVGVSGCATWSYAVEFSPATSQLADAGVDVTYEPGIGGNGQLVIRNASEDPVYLVWDDLTVVRDGVQSKAYKGSVRVIHKEMSVPKQMVSPGATISETVVADAGYVKVAKRPATAVDYTLGWVYGLGVLIGNRWWEPTAEYIDEQLPNWSERGFSLMVPLETAGSLEVLELKAAPEKVATARVPSPD